MSEALDALLEVQDHDTRLDQIRHRIESLPERAELESSTRALSGLEASIETESATKAEIVREQRRLEDEIDSIGEKKAQVEATLYDGSVTNARELQDLQEESEALGRRVTQLEDRDIELMEQLEPIDERLRTLEESRDAEKAKINAIEVRLTAAEAELLVEVDKEEGLRASVAKSVPADLLGEYESLRSGLGGVGVARLVGSQCGGCHLTLAAMEVARLRKSSDQVAHCEECGRLLVV